MLLLIELKIVKVNYKYMDVIYFNVGNVFFKYICLLENGIEMI